jgi:hypothetical protein
MRKAHRVRAGCEGLSTNSKEKGLGRTVLSSRGRPVLCERWCHYGWQRTSPKKWKGPPIRRRASLVFGAVFPAVRLVLPPIRLSCGCDSVCSAGHALVHRGVTGAFNFQRAASCRRQSKRLVTVPAYREGLGLRQVGNPTPCQSPCVCAVSRGTCPSDCAPIILGGSPSSFRIRLA